MKPNHQIAALTPEGQLGLQAQIAAFEKNAFATLEALKERFLLWNSIKKAWPTIGRYTPYKTLRDLVGKSLYDQNESMNRATAQFVAMIKKLMNGELYIVGYSTDSGASIQLGAIEAKKYRQIKAEQNLSGLLMCGIWVIVAAVTVIAGLIAYKHLERGLDVIAATNDNTAKNLDLQFWRLYSDMQKADPLKAALLLKWWTEKKEAAKAADSRSWWDKATDTLKTVGVSGFGGLALGLLLALMLGRKSAR
jgi:hypothetical protein